MPIIELDDTRERPDGVDDGSQRPERVVRSCRAAENTAAKAEEVRFAVDSLLEEAGFEPSVPP